MLNQWRALIKVLFHAGPSEKKASPLTMNYTQLHIFTHYEAMKITDIFA